MTTKIITKLKLEGKKEIINTFKTKKRIEIKKITQEKQKK